MKKATRKKITFLERLDGKRCSERIMGRMYRYSKDSNFEVRYNVAEAAVVFPYEKVEEILLRLAKDKNALVRTNACDSMCISYFPRTKNTLKEMAGDSNYLVRGYAVMSLADVVRNLGDDNGKQECILFIEDLLRKEKEDWARTIYYKELCKLGRKEYFNNVLKALENEDYHVRYLGVKYLKEELEGMEWENRKKSIKPLERMLEKEDGYIQHDAREILEKLYLEDRKDELESPTC